MLKSSLCLRNAAHDLTVTLPAMHILPSIARPWTEGRLAPPIQEVAQAAAQAAAAAASAAHASARLPTTAAVEPAGVDTAGAEVVNHHFAGTFLLGRCMMWLQYLTRILVYKMCN